MGAICGVISLSNKKLKDNIGKKMIDGYNHIKFDDHYEYKDSQCHVAYLHHEIVGIDCEKSPFYNNDVIVLVDGVIDNRETLLAQIGLDENIGLTNSEIIAKLYEKYHMDFIDQVIGDYAICIIDRENMQCYLVRDHMGSRCLYYHVKDGVLYFSTLINPIVSCDSSISLSEKWLATYLGISEITHEIEGEFTMYNKINYVGIASYYKFCYNDMVKKCYWEPRNCQKLVGISRTKCLEELQKIYKEAVRCRTVTSSDVGIFLSGGLDSASVAVEASRVLKAQGKSLYSFTSVPMEQYKDWLSNKQVANEEANVKDIISKYDNIIPSFLSHEDKDAFSIIDDMIAVLEGPYKYIENAVYLDDITKQASLAGCKVILYGQFGNLLLSYGNIELIVYDYILQGRLIKAFREYNYFLKFNKCDRKRSFWNYFKAVVSNIFYRERGGYVSPLLKNDLAHQYDVDQRLINIGYTKKKLIKSCIPKHCALNEEFINHLSNSSTKISMKYGVMRRDPTKDKRVVEYIYKIPDEYFCHNGFNRAIIKTLLQGQVPDRLLDNYTPRGRQSADWLQRIELKWQEIIQEAETYLNNDIMASYLDVDAYKALLSKYPKVAFTEKAAVDIRSIIIVIVLGRTLCKIKGGWYNEKGMART